MATKHLYKQKGSNNWWVRISFEGEVIRRSTGTDDEKQAQRFHDELKAQLWKQPKLKGKTWGMAVLAWCEKRTRGDYDLLALTKFARFYPDRALRDVTRENVDEALSRFCTTPETYTRHRARILSILNLSKLSGWLHEVPTLSTRESGKKKSRMWITPAQWQVLYRELPKHMKPMAEFAIESGLRQSNVLQLTWEKVDLERQTMWVEAEDAKANKAIAVPLSRRAVEVLKGQVGGHDTYVFTYQSRPIKEIKTGWINACIRAGLGRYVVDDDGKPHYEGFVWHGLRHTWATWHVQNGTPVEVLQKLGGWSDLRMVMKYAHHSPGYLANFANNNQRLNDAPPSDSRE